MPTSTQGSSSRDGIPEMPPPSSIQAFCDPPGHRRPWCAREIPCPTVAYPSRLRSALLVASVAEVVLYAAVWIAMDSWALAFLAIPFVGFVTIVVLGFQYVRNTAAAPMAAWLAGMSDEGCRLLAEGDRLNALRDGILLRGHPDEYGRHLMLEHNLRERQERILFGEKVAIAMNKRNA